jgi:transposase-like protein
MRRIRRIISNDEKLKIIGEYLQTNVTQASLMTKYNLRKNGCITDWMRKFAIPLPTQEEIDIQNIMAKEATNKTARELELEAKVKLLEDALDKEQFRTKALNTMIDIIEKDFKIPVRKKFGAKR